MRSAIATFAAVAFVPAASAQIASLHAWMTADNEFSARISEFSTTPGTEFLLGNSWGTTYQGDYLFTQPGTFYLHVRANDGGDPAMLIARFEITSGNATFGNGATSILTGDPAWIASDVTPSLPPLTPAILGPNGSSPWGMFPLMGGASFIWSPNNVDQVWFTVPVHVVPAPATMALALAGLALARRRR